MLASVLKRLLFLLILFSTLFCQGQEPVSFNKKVDEWLGSSELEHSSIGLFFQDANTGEILTQTTPQLSLVPGSILKLVTTATALEKFGSDFRFKTKLAYSGEIKNDSLIGNLFIIGGGDPALGSKYFKENYSNPHFLDEWTFALKEKKIHHITGDIIADASIYEDQMIPNTWIWEDLGNYYGAGACGLSVYDNLYQIHLSSSASSGELTLITNIEPKIPKIVFDNQVLSSNDKRDQAYVFGSPLESKRVIRGTIPKGRQDFILKASIPDPPYLLAYQLKNKLEISDISISGNIKTDAPPTTKDQQFGEVKLLATTFSPPLIDIIRVTNHESVNLFAEHLLKHLAYNETGIGSTKTGIEIINRFWELKGINNDGFFMADGSGLSRFNAITARQVVEIMGYMKNKSLYENLFFSSIPSVPNGTLYFFDPVNFPKETLRAKSGSMTRVRSYAGVLQTKSGKEILFTVMLNNFSCSQAKAIDLIEELLVALKYL